MRKVLNLSELMLEEGQAVAAGGLGYAGNVFDHFFDTASTGGLDEIGPYADGFPVTGFALFRYGWSDWLTLEAGVTVSKGVPRAMVGGVARFSPETVGSLAIAGGEDSGLSYLAELGWKKNGWELVAKSFRRERLIRRTWVAPTTSITGVTTTYDPDWEHLADIKYTFGPHLDVGVIARAQPEADFVLPYLRWRPTRALSVRLRPDPRGEYQLDASYRISQVSEIFAIAHASAQAMTYTRRFENDLTFTGTLQHDDLAGWRVGLGLAAPRLLDWDVNWNLTGFAGEANDFSLQGGISKDLAPGVQLFAEAYRAFDTGGENTNLQPGEFRVRVGLRFDIGFSGDGIVRAPYNGIDVHEGALVGRVRTAAGSKGAFGNIPVMINGREAARTEEDGSFYVPNVSQGVHVVTIDEEKLPIEHIPQKGRTVARVAPGAATTVEFRTVVVYGVAGRVTKPSGDPVAGADLRILNANGEDAGRSSSNAFGYFRADGLPPGRYMLQVVDDKEKVKAQRSFTIGGEFLFGIDLTVKG